MPLTLLTDAAFAAPGTEALRLESFRPATRRIAYMALIAEMRRLQAPSKDLLRPQNSTIRCSGWARHVVYYLTLAHALVHRFLRGSRKHVLFSNSDLWGLRQATSRKPNKNIIGCRKTLS